MAYLKGLVAKRDFKGIFQLEIVKEANGKSGEARIDFTHIQEVAEDLLTIVKKKGLLTL